MTVLVPPQSPSLLYASAYDVLSGHSSFTHSSSLRFSERWVWTGRPRSFAIEESALESSSVQLGMKRGVMTGLTRRNDDSTSSMYSSVLSIDSFVSSHRKSGLLRSMFTLPTRQGSPAFSSFLHSMSVAAGWIVAKMLARVVVLCRRSSTKMSYALSAYPSSRYFASSGKVCVFSHCMSSSSIHRPRNWYCPACTCRSLRPGMTSLPEKSFTGRLEYLSGRCLNAPSTFPSTTTSHPSSMDREHDGEDV